MKTKSSSSYLNLLKEATNVKIPIKHSGMLEVPEGKDVENMPFDHFKGLVKKKGLAPISRALTNLIVWNRKKNPTLSKKVDTIQNKLTDWVNKEREKTDNENLYE